MALLAPKKEERNLFDSSAARPGDITVSGWARCQGKPTAFDVTVTSPLQQSCLVHTITNPNFALMKAAEAKVAKCHDLCSSCGMEFVPLVVSTFGAWDSIAADNIREMAKLQASNNGCAISQTVKHTFEKLAICLQRGNGNLLFNRNPTPHAHPNVDGHV
jgi:hypothetical protein